MRAAAQAGGDDDVDKDGGGEDPGGGPQADCTGCGCFCWDSVTAATHAR
jgi:hypothetical protein